ncbi:hypothetical protein RJ639_010370 [Escallonia herrerae]|uniref:S-adenosylmethionine-dependent methyltransferase n=1 Tax=Escallonia herrerae TaxID=1293975 RepID=A0AA88VP46_9ASTE|nr:hypothetical protein RJ639_010370 [Escallonia herrerae]
MADEQGTVSFAMVGGDGPHSYRHNSSYQAGAVASAKALISNAIAEIFDVNHLTTSSGSIGIADLGCSVGPNTFITVKNIIDSVELKCQSHGFGSQVLEFQVFFNDHVSNDFNMLFKSLPNDRHYFAAGVPGSFHGRLFPKASLHFVNASYAIHWLSRVPKDVVDEQSPAWNKGRVYYTNAPNQVIKAYSAQFARDMDSFFEARAQELVSGGLMTLVIPCLPVGTAPSQSPIMAVADLLGDSLLDMANMGLVSEDKVDSFNLPSYNPTPQELENLIKRNGCFEIVKLEPSGRAPVTKETAPNIQMFMSHLRAAWGGLLVEHFGVEIMDDLFVRFTEKVADSSTLSPSSYRMMVELFVLLQRKAA